MIVIRKVRSGEPSEDDAVLVYDGESEEMWGIEPHFTSHIGKVGLTEEAFAAFFDGPWTWAYELEEGEDPFEDYPDEQVVNYPEHDVEIPDVPPPMPAARFRDKYDSREEAFEAAGIEMTPEEWVEHDDAHPPSSELMGDSDDEEDSPE